MKKNYLISAALLGVSSFALLSGFDSAETADSVLQKYYEASQSDVSAAVVVDAKADGTLSVADMGLSLDATGDAKMNMQMSTNPLALSMDATMNVSAMGTSGSKYMGMYMVVDENGSLVIYVGTEGEWTKQTLSSEQTESLLSMVNNPASIDYSSLPVSFTLADAPVDVEGKECYELTAALTWSDIKDVFKWSIDQVDVNELIAAQGESVSEEDTDVQASLDELMSMLDMVDPYTAGLQLNVTMDITTDTYQAVFLRLDMDGSDWSSLAMIAGSALGLTNDDGTAMNVEVAVNDLYMTYLYDYSADVSISVPDEVVNSATELDEDSLNEITDSIEELS